MMNRRHSKIKCGKHGEMISWALISFSESQTTVRNKMNAHNSIALEELGDGVSQGDCIVRN